MLSSVCGVCELCFDRHVPNMLGQSHPCLMHGHHGCPLKFLYDMTVLPVYLKKRKRSVLDMLQTDTLLTLIRDYSHNLL